MITGRDALFSVEQAITQVRTNESQLDGALHSAMAEAERLRSEEAEAFRMLARIKLDAMASQKVIGNIDATERRALDMIQKHRQTIETLARRRDELQATLDTAEATKHDRNQDLAQAIDVLEELRQRTAERVKTDPAWLATKAAVDAAEKVAANADQKAAQAESDLAAKRKPYEDDPLFIYLWKKKHGQAEDTSGNLVRFFDRKVALLVDYQGARANFVMLQEIPARLREHAKEKLGDLGTAKTQLAEVERRALVADGVEAAEARVEAADAAMKQAEEAVAKATAELQQIDADRQRVVGAGEDAAYSGAIDMLAQGLAREDLNRLYQEALQTPAKEDEQAIEAISRSREALRKADAEVAQIRTEIRELAQRRGELEGARDRARRVGYDNPMGNFGGNADVIAGAIGGILAGVLRGNDLDRVLRDNYQRPQPRVDPDFGGGRMSGPWPGSTWTGGGDSPTWGDAPPMPGGGGGSDDSGWQTDGKF
jgi:chromosome segregation ATPase